MSAKYEQLKRARKAAEKALKALVDEDLLYQHHGNICKREGTYDRLADSMIDFLNAEKKLNEQ